MSELPAHIRNERATREHNFPGYPPLSLPNLACVAFCTDVVVSNQWFYHGADHVVLAPLGSPEPCPKCIRSMVTLLGRSPAGRPSEMPDADKARLLRVREAASLLVCACVYPIETYRNGHGHKRGCPADFGPGISHNRFDGAYSKLDEET